MLVAKQDLFTVMIQGPSRTPYEDGLFFFDVQLPANYPCSPPTFFYISYCSDRLNPNLYEDGKVCVSLLGTWTGKVYMHIFIFSLFAFVISVIWIFHLFFHDLMVFFGDITRLQPEKIKYPKGWSSLGLNTDNLKTWAT